MINFSLLWIANIRTDKVEGLFEVLLEVLMAGVRSWYLSVDDTPFFVISRKLGGDVEDSGGTEGPQ